MRTRDKVVTRESLKNQIREAQAHGKRVVLANGCFDILHVGHARYLSAAKSLGDVLVVAVNSDSSAGCLKGPGRPILSEHARAELVAALGAVDFVVIFTEPNVEKLLEELRPEVHAKGTDYTLETVPERAIAEQLGIRVAIAGDQKNHSTRDLLARIAGSPNG